MNFTVKESRHLAQLRTRLVLHGVFGAVQNIPATLLRLIGAVNARPNNIVKNIKLDWKAKFWPLHFTWLVS